MLFVAAVATLESAGMAPEEVERIVNAYGTDLLRVAFMYLKDRHKAEDVCQEVFIKYYRALKAFDSKEHEKAWLLRVTINLCKDQLKSFWSKHMVMDDGTMNATVQSGDDVEKTIQNKELYETVFALPEMFKTVIILYYYEGLNTQEIAHVIGAPDATVRSRLKRARERLGTLLQGGERS